VDVDLIRNSPIGNVVPISGFDQRAGESYEHWAYIPDPLPETIDLTTPTWSLVARAEAALGRLDEASRQLPEPSLLRRPALLTAIAETPHLRSTRFLS
jgi:hypothetical protein